MRNKPPSTLVIAQADSTSKVDWAGVGLFVLLTFALTWALCFGFWELHVRAGLDSNIALGISAALGMFMPALVCALLRGPIRHEGFADSGLKLGFKDGGWRVYLGAYAFVPIWFLAAIVLTLASGTQHWDPAHGMRLVEGMIADSLKSEPARIQGGPLLFSVHQLAVLQIYSSFAEAFTIAIPINCIFTFGEELGWRGYLLPRLAPLGGAKAAAISGAIWGLWHAPIILLYGYNYPDHRAWGVLMMIVLTTAMGFVFAWLRFRSGSIGPGMVAHAAMNAQAGLAIILLSQGKALLMPPAGLFGIIPVALFALWLWRTRRLTPDQNSSV